MNGVGALVVGAIGVGWTIFAAQMGAPGFFSFFGVGFVVLAIIGAAYNFINATSKNRFSTFDVTDGREEPDPLNARFGQFQEAPPGGRAAFCPFCGAKAEEDHQFCKSCGKKLS